MHIHAFIPALFTPLKLWQQDFGFQPESKALMRLLAGSRRQALPVKGLERTLLYRLGLDVHEHLPWAGLRYAFESDDLHHPPLMCADPVYMETGSDAILLHADAPVLSREETELLFVDLNQHLEQDGLILKACHPQRWYLHALDAHDERVERFSKALPSTTPLSEVGGENIFPFLPQSADKYFRQLFNEIQMLLHNHTVNVAREANGQLPVNGVWFWGEGDVDASKLEVSTAVQSIQSVQGGGSCGEVIAAACGVEWRRELGMDLSTVDAAKGDVMVILDQLVAPVRADRPEIWQAALTDLDAYFVYLTGVLQAGGEVTLYDAAGNQWECENMPAWQFWRNRVADWRQFIA